MGIKKTERRFRIKRRVRKKISGTQARPRLSVFRSNTSLYAQIIDDENAKTLISCSSKEIKKEGRSVNLELAKEVGKKLAEKAKEQGITSVVLDRNGYLYHGRVKAFADGARESGLQF